MMDEDLLVLMHYVSVSSAEPMRRVSALRSLTNLQEKLERLESETDKANDLWAQVQDLENAYEALRDEHDVWQDAAMDAMRLAHQERERAKEAEAERDLACAEATRLSEELEFYRMTSQTYAQERDDLEEVAWQGYQLRDKLRAKIQALEAENRGLLQMLKEAENNEAERTLEAVKMVLGYVP